jgi:hypothetical protein
MAGLQFKIDARSPGLRKHGLDGGGRVVPGHA